ncbi:uncharacterized protein LOC119291910 [Triticum dicoccoides]|uniref:uncharacterized protein LOC119291910 n=1 Tax=Triticum dicoccoides TaxID=85692 RepID=UPI00188FB395|nr:uncharacterized protein LOC119291910 [Triticum dicoccoides]
MLDSRGGGLLRSEIALILCGCEGRRRYCDAKVPIAEEQGVSTGHVYKRKRQKLVITRGKRPADIGSNEEEPVGDVNEADVTQDAEQKKKRRKVTENEGPRNRSSPTRLFKLNKDLVKDQKSMIRGIDFGGLLDITTTSMPGDLRQWIMKHYDPEKSQIVIPDRGKIPVDAESVRRIWGLPNSGRKVCFEMNPDVIREFNSIFKIEGKMPLH